MGIQYRPDIDGLRAVAVVGVVLFHAFPALLPGGFVGVDVFFVLSGFLITSIIRSEVEAGNFSIGRFYERRFRRILPALVAMLIPVTIFATMILPPGELADYGKRLASVAIFVSNIVFWRESGYFETPSADEPLLHTWSLAVEEQFYIVWPVLVAWLVHRGSRLVLNSFVWLAVLTSFVAAVWAVRFSPDQAFYLLPYRAWEFGLGALLAIGAVPAFRSVAMREAMGWAGLALIVASMTLYTHDTPFPGLAAVPPCLGTLLIVHVGQGHPTSVGRWLSLRPMVFTGLISYSFYLWHWPIIVLAQVALNRSLHIWEAVFAVVTAFGIAAVSLHLVERPFRGRENLQLPRSRLFAGSGVLSAIMASAGILAWQSGGFIAYATPQTRWAEASRESFNPLRAKCHVDFGITRLPPAEDCIAPVNAAGVHYDVLLWGDSHADHLMPGLVALAEQHDWKVRQATGANCSPLALYIKYAKHGASCPSLMRQALDEAAQQTSLSAIVISASWSNILRSTVSRMDGGSRDVREEVAVKRFTIAIQQLIQLVRSKVGPVTTIILVGSTPEFDVWPGTCAARAAKLGASLERCRVIRAIDDRWGPMADALLAQMRHPHVHVVLPRTLFCRGHHCITMQRDEIFFRDDDHLTIEGSHIVAARLLNGLHGKVGAGGS